MPKHTQEVERELEIEVPATQRSQHAESFSIERGPQDLPMDERANTNAFLYTPKKVRDTLCVSHILQQYGGQHVSSTVGFQRTEKNHWLSAPCSLVMARTFVPADVLESRSDSESFSNA